MAKIKYNLERKDSQSIRSAFKFFYENKFFKKWMSKYTLKGLDYQQQDFVMKKFWSDGTIAMSRPDGIPTGLVELGNDEVIFTPWVMSDVYNIYDFPTKAIPVNLRGVSFVSNKPLKVDKEIVIIYCQKNHKSVYSTIECKINELVDIEMVKRIALKSQKQSFLFTTTPENKSAIEKLAKDLESDEPSLFTTLEDSQLAKGLLSGAPYILDKLEIQRQKIEDDILTLLGCNNVGIAEKKEHLLNGEIDANNQSVQESGDEFLDMIQEGFERGTNVFGFQVEVVDNSPALTYSPDQEENENDNEGNINE